MGHAPGERSRQDDAFWKLVAFAAHYAPFYAEQEWARRIRAGEDLDRSDIPTLKKTDILNSSAEVVATIRVPGHEKRYVVHTSGSTGTPLSVLKSRQQSRIELAENRPLKESWRLWEYSSQLFVETPTTTHPFGKCTTRQFPQQTVYHLFGLDAPLLAATIAETGVQVVHTWPSVARGLIEVCLEDGLNLQVRLLTTRAEVVHPDLRILANEVLGCRILDVYGCIETGILAAECAECGCYHTPSESALVEVIAADGSPAEPGQEGQVVVTPLHSYAMPLLRYETGDLATVAEPKSCGRGPLSIQRMTGREKHLFIAPDGRRFAPMVGASKVSALPLRQYKLTQLDPETVEVTFVPRSGVEVNQQALRDLVRDALPAGFLVKSRPVQVIPPGESGKYIMHERLFDP